MRRFGECTLAPNLYTLSPHSYLPLHLCQIFNEDTVKTVCTCTLPYQVNRAEAIYRDMTRPTFPNLSLICIRQK